MANQTKTKTETTAVAPTGNNRPASRQSVSTKGIDAEILKSPYNIRELSLEDADKAIANIIKTGKGLRKLAHETACGILLHYAEHGDYTRLQRENDKQEPRLMEAIEGAFSRSMRTAFIEWVTSNSSLRFNQDKKTFYHNRRDKRIPEGKRGYVSEEAFRKPFFEMERGNQWPKPVAFNELLKTFVQRAERLLKEKQEGVKRGDIVKKIRHDIDEQAVLDLEAFAKAHGVTLEAETGTGTNG